MEKSELSLLETVKNWARNIKRDVIALWIAGRDQRVPWHAKAVAGFVAAYALSPLDLIPDFIPVIGYLDDLLIVPLGILLAVKLIPPWLMSELRATALARQQRPTSRAAAAAIVLIWIASVLLLLWAFRP